MSQQALYSRFRAASISIGHVGELELGSLEVEDRLAELLSLLGVAKRELEGALGAAQAHGADGEAPAVEGCEHLPEAVAPLAQEGVRRAAGASSK